MIVERTHLASLSLMVLACAIAVAEYTTYTPTLAPDSMDYDAGQSGDDEKSDVLDDDAEKNTDEEEEIERSEGVMDVSKSDPFASAGEKEVTISSGDTLASVITNLGFDKTDVYLASKALSKVFNLRNLKIGQKIVVKGTRDKKGDLTLNGIELRPDYKSKIVVKKNESGYSAEKLDVPVKKVVRSISGRMLPKSPEYSLKKCGVKLSVSREALRGLSQVVNVRTARAPIDFEFLYQDYYDDEGHVVKKSDLLYAAVFINGKILRIYKFTYGNTSEFVDSNGMILSTKNRNASLLGQPLGVMKVTSHFGIRKHPISGKIRGHKGIDIAARVGTPIVAPANGVVERASYYSGYGMYVKIRHTATVSTAYGHLSKIAVRTGQHVTKGQTIGYVGRTGNTTGSHLHYELHKCGHPINPLTFVKKEPQRLTGDKLSKFNRFKRNVNIQVVGLIPSRGSKAKLHKYS